jgi:hypothetical protein
MIYEVRSYRLKPRSIPQFLDIFGAAYEKRKEFSPLSAFLFTEIGPLNEVIHIWPYESYAERDRIRVEAVKSGHWPPKGAEFIVDQKSEIYTPFPFVGVFATGNLGPLFEWREYTVVTGMMPAVMEGWEESIDERRKASPLIIAMQTDSGGLSKFVHLWGYKDFAHRAEVRADMLNKGIWPPKGTPVGALRYQENKICLAAPFSPLQ